MPAIYRLIIGCNQIEWLDLRFQEPKALDLVDILPQSRIDFVRIQRTMCMAPQSLVAFVGIWISKAYNLWTLGHVSEQIKLT
jgi:hypothetical protein